MPTKCDCDPTKKRKSVPNKGVQVNKTKTNKGCVVKNIIVINNNGCCSDKGGKTKKRSSKRKSTRTKSEPMTERIEVVETPKKTSRKKRNTERCSSPLVDYSPSERSSKRESKAKKVKATTNTRRTSAKATKQRSVAKAVSVPKRNKARKDPPLIEVVDYEELYNGKRIKRREKRSRQNESPRGSSSKSVVVIESPKETESRKSLKEAIREYRDNRLARRTQDVGRRQETLPAENVPTYIIEESPKALPSPKKSETVLALPPGVNVDDLKDISDCSQLSGKNREACLRRQRAQKVKRR